IGSIFIGFKGVLSAPLGPFRFMRIKEATKLSLWPNVYTTVAELNEASFSQIVNVIGGKFLFVLILAGIALAALKRDGQGKLDPKYLILLLIWFVATIYASTKGIRFTMLIVPPLSIAFGTFIGKAFEYANGFCERSLHLSKKVVAPVLLLLFAIALFSPAKAWYQSTINDIPIVNDAWWNTLTKIRQESQPNAIINSWWDFGHHFKYIADRAVTFDGASQNKPMAHWIGKVLLTGNEEEAIGILRMLDCGSNSAFKELDKKINDASKTVKLLYELVVLDKSGAEKLLKENGLLKDEIQNVLRYTHCEPPEDYFITSDDMISKAGVWAHFGSWNFDRADLWLSRNEPKEKFVQKAVKDNNYSQEEALRLYTELQGIKTEREGNSWIAPWPNYASGLASCSQKKNIVECNNGITINLENYSATIPTNNGIIQPSSVVYVEGPDVVEKKFNTSNDLSLSLIPVEGGYQVILMQKELGLSMFNRLYFFRGHGLRHFKLFDAQRQLSGGWIYTWKVDWDGGDKNEVYVSEKQNKTTEVIKVEDEQESTNKSSTNGAENVTSTVLVE
ncbi:MAG: STT3 domain-containing protein, partial [Candidatus Woesearchaeota archaeon]